MPCHMSTQVYTHLLGADAVEVGEAAAVLCEVQLTGLGVVAIDPADNVGVGPSLSIPEHSNRTFHQKYL